MYFAPAEPSRRGRGFRRLIMKAAQGCLIDAGVVEVTLMIRHGNGAVQGFHVSLGYEVEPRGAMAYWVEW